ncbi:MAG: hypothetical protein MJ003_05665 [Paludibacteraceae bacterium]|nr:hypothetical protein [Paludibacteraceae bacterium]
MAKIDLENTETQASNGGLTEQINDIPVNETQNGSSDSGAIEGNSVIVPPSTINPSNNISGLSYKEINDPNEIVVSVADTKAPIIVLFGPPSCGKTMTLVRLTRYLRKNGYTVTPDKSFRPNYDANYSKICNDFNSVMNSNDAADSTSRISFMLVKIMKNGRTICQLLEAPGEYYFNPEDPNAPFPAYVHSIMSASNRKIYLFMVEPDWMNPSDRKNYVSKIANVKTNMRRGDKSLIVFNKIDLTPYQINGNGKVYVGQALKNVKDMYPNLVELFKNDIPLIRLFKPYNCGFSTFKTGDYVKTANGSYTYIESADNYPAKLWKDIVKYIQG